MRRTLVLWQRLCSLLSFQKPRPLPGTKPRWSSGRLPLVVFSVASVGVTSYWVHDRLFQQRHWLYSDLLNGSGDRFLHPVRASWNEAADNKASAGLSWRLLEERLRIEERKLRGPLPEFQIYTAADGKKSFKLMLRLQDSNEKHLAVRRAAPGDDLLAAFATVLETLQESSLRIPRVTAQSSATSTTVTAQGPQGELLHVFLPHVGGFAAELCYSKPPEHSALSDQEITALVEAYRTTARGLSTSEREPRHRIEQDAGSSSKSSSSLESSKRPWRRSRDDVRMRIVQEKLEAMGVDVYLPPTSPGRENENGAEYRDIDWGALAGYENIKQSIEASLVLPLRHGEVYDDIAKGTRREFTPNRPRALLFAGPPGCGKTSTARIIAEQAEVPFIHVTLESVVSRFYGASEKQLSSIFDLALELGGAILFIDEVDALGTSRDRGEIHEATRRTLSVLLRRLDGLHREAGKRPKPQSRFYEDNPFGSLPSLPSAPSSANGDVSEDADAWFVVIAATNRMQDLDQALLSRFDIVLEFPLPDFSTRQSIYEMYAKHLKPEDVRKLATATEGLSPRAIHDSCLEAERQWAAGIIRGQHPRNSLPDVCAYLTALEFRSERLLRDAGSVVGPHSGTSDMFGPGATHYIHLPSVGRSFAANQV
ncbi:hypothetical protein F1559_002644 [Cyanidiococcus yangmingshanensis]|uniref:AAA+ ATPase domain-containing protein n=1 Tax=Cyanidiococcus yangmingshanensis TaxID=2690220 RepID=A0A7J7IMM4_9RHOD|nr:hypothetical protein F1559_002644 [Cyanidiococcus yangmingshanensis]